MRGISVLVLESCQSIVSAGLLDKRRIKVTDTRLLDERDVRDDQIWVLQGKTNAKRRIEITGELKVLIDRIMSRKKEHTVRSKRLIVSEDGTPMTVAMLRGRFDLAREAAGVAKSEFQMRDLRAKAGTDKDESSGDIMQTRDHFGILPLS